jgi:hypothetical protein
MLTLPGRSASLLSPIRTPSLGSLPNFLITLPCPTGFLLLLLPLLLQRQGSPHQAMDCVAAPSRGQSGICPMNRQILSRSPCPNMASQGARRQRQARKWEAPLPKGGGNLMGLAFRGDLETRGPCTENPQEGECRNPPVRLYPPPISPLPEYGRPSQTRLAFRSAHMWTALGHARQSPRESRCVGGVSGEWW